MKLISRKPKPKHRRKRYPLRRVILVATIAVLLGFVLGSQAHASVHSSKGTVSTFNDGFTTSKQDDCQQGFAPACAWMASTK